MRKIGFAALGLGLALTALVSQPRPASAQACTLLCVQGKKCCVHADGTQSCIPQNQKCR